MTKGRARRWEPVVVLMKNVKFSSAPAPAGAMNV
jgi:hypothetical protein